MRTKSRRQALTILVVWVAMFSCVGLAASPAYQAVQVGDSSVVLAFPAGYVDLCGRDKEAAEMLLPLVPATNRPLGCYTTAEDFTEWVNAKGGRFRSFLFTSIMKSSVAGKVTDKEFLEFRNSMRKQIATIYQSLVPELQKQINIETAKISDRYGADVQTHIDGITPIGLFDETPGHFSSVWIADAEHTVDGKITAGSQVQVSSAVLLKGRVFVLFTYGKLVSSESVEQYKQVARAWTAQFVDVNE